MGTVERRLREREARRRAVLDAARGLVRERGFNGTTTKQIAERCELSEATLFFYFQSKDEILMSLLLEGAEFMAAGLETIVSAKAPPDKKLRRTWRFFAEVQREHPEYIQVSAHLAHPQATASVASDVRGELATRSGASFRRLADLMSGVVEPSQARVGADVLWATFLGLVLLRDARSNLGLAVHPDEGDLSDALELLMSGLGGPPS